MAEAENGGSHFQVHYSKAVGEALRELQRKATRRGQGQAFLSAFREIVRALREVPNEVGEALYRLPNLRLQVRTVVVAPLAIDFAVSEDHPFVYIKGGKLLSAHGS
jgi:GTP1/Obg family GTP-binding protein